MSLSHLQLQHYRADCVGALKKSCEKEYKAVSVRDNNIWRFRQQLVSRTTDMLKSGAEPVVKFLFVNRGLFFDL